MTRAELKEIIISMIQDGELDLKVNGYSTENEYNVKVELIIDGYSYIETEAYLQKN